MWVHVCMFIWAYTCAHGSQRSALIVIFQELFTLFVKADSLICLELVISKIGSSASPRDLLGSTWAGPSHGFRSSCLQGEHYWLSHLPRIPWLTHFLEYNFSCKGLFWWTRCKAAVCESGFSHVALSVVKGLTTSLTVHPLTSCHLWKTKERGEKEMWVWGEVWRVQCLFLTSPALPASWGKPYSLFWPVCTCNLPLPCLKTQSAQETRWMNAGWKLNKSSQNVWDCKKICPLTNHRPYKFRD